MSYAWPKPIVRMDMDNPGHVAPYSVADALAFDALPDAVKEAARRVLLEEFREDELAPALEDIDIKQKEIDHEIEYREKIRLDLEGRIVTLEHELDKLTRKPSLPRALWRFRKRFPRQQATVRLRCTYTSLPPAPIPARRKRQRMSR